MIVTELGHGTMSVMAEGAHVLIDPVLTNVFMGGIAVPEPARDLDLIAMPHPDLVIVTHFHAGHLEPESLALLDRKITVAVPRDPTILQVLDQLGFDQVMVVQEGDELEVGVVRIKFTGTGQQFPYVGVVIADADGTFWHMGDRGDTLAPRAIEHVVRSFEGGIDVLVASHPSDFHSFLLHSTCDGGAFEGEEHPRWVERALETIALVRPRLVLPLTTNFRYVGRAEWLNHFMFPMRPQEFVELARRYVSEVSADLLAPSDAVVLKSRQVSIHRQAATWVTVRPGPDLRGLDQTESIAVLDDPDPEGVGDDELFVRIKRYVTQELVPWLADHYGVYADLIRVMRHGESTFRLDVVLPSGKMARWRVEWIDGQPIGHELLFDEAPRYNELHTRIAGSTLDRWVRDVIPYFVAAADTRRAGSLWNVACSATGRVSVTAVAARCLVSAHLMSDRHRLDRWLAAEVDRVSLDGVRS